MQELDALLASLRERSAELAKAQPAPVVTPAVAVAPETAPAAPVVPAAQDAAKPEEGTEAPAAAAQAEPAQAAAQAAGEELSDEANAAIDAADEFEVTDADGVVRKAIDGFALLKAMQAEVDASRTEVAAMRAELDAIRQAPIGGELVKSFTDGAVHQATVTETLAKSLANALDAVQASQHAVSEQAARIEAQDARLTQQDALVKSLSAAVEKFGAQGVGRVSAVTAHERTSPMATVAKSMSVGDVFAKAQALNQSGVINGSDVGRIVAYANGGHGVPPDLAHHFAA